MTLVTKPLGWGRPDGRPGPPEGKPEGKAPVGRIGTPGLLAYSANIFSNEPLTAGESTCSAGTNTLGGSPTGRATTTWSRLSGAQANKGDEGDVGECNHFEDLMAEDRAKS
jgi:hypothetical protein